MKYFGILVLILIGCQNRKLEETDDIIRNEDTIAVSIDKLEYKTDREFLDSLYTCTYGQFISKLEEVANTDTNAYRITIKSENGNWEKSKLIDTRPKMSRISFCNELYTVVSFPCGGPCHSEVFIFTNEDRPDEQFDYVQQVKNNPNFIGHIRNEEFEKLIIHNFKNNKELAIDISDSHFLSYGQMDSIVRNENNIKLYYTNKNEKYKIKTIDIESIL